MTEFFKIRNGRLALHDIELGEDKFFYKDNDPKKTLLKGVTFKVHTGILAKFLTFLGKVFHSELPSQKIYVNKNSFIDFVVRAVVCHDPQISTAEFVSRCELFYNNKGTIEQKNNAKEMHKVSKKFFTESLTTLESQKKLPQNEFRSDFEILADTFAPKLIAIKESMEKNRRIS